MRNSIVEGVNQLLAYWGHIQPLSRIIDETGSMCLLCSKPRIISVAWVQW